MIGIVALNLGGPDSPEAVEPFLRNLFSDPDVIQLGPLGFMQPLLARFIARRRAPFSRAAYAQIGGRSPIREETTAQAQSVATALSGLGIAARPYVGMACWHPFCDEAAAALRKDGIKRVIALPLFPHHSRTTTGSSFGLLDKALAGSNVAVARVEHYPDAPGYVEALAATIHDAVSTLPAQHRLTAPVVFSAHGLPESYIRRGDRYLDDIRVTVAAVRDALALGDRVRLCFQSRIGPQKWLSPHTETTLDELASAGEKAVVVVPVSFTGEHIETLQEIDILYRDRARARGIEHFARAHTVGCHPAFIAALASLCAAEARARKWA